MHHDTHAKRGMKSWIDTTERVARARNVNTAGGIENLAYDVYKRHAINQQIRRLGGAPISTPQPRIAAITRGLVKMTHENFEWRAQGNFAHRANFTANSPQSQQLQLRKRDQGRTGLSARFSLGSTRFHNPSQGVRAWARATHEYGKLANITADWISSQHSTGGKVMTPRSLSTGRPDHAVLYSKFIRAHGRRDDQSIQQTGQQLSQRLGGTGSLFTPLGMDRLAPGVGYGELVRTQRINGHTYRATGYGPGERESSSFGRNRARIIRHAIQDYRRLGVVGNPQDRRRALNSSLSQSVSHYGYDTRDPSRIKSSVVRQRLGRLP